MKINCLSCGHKIELDDVYDDYQGLVKCVTCGAMLDLKTEEGRLKSVRITDVALLESLINEAAGVGE